MRPGLVIAAVLVLTGCGQPQSAAGSSPSPIISRQNSAPVFGPLAVMVHRAGPDEQYFVQLVAVDGRGGPAVQALSRAQKTLFFMTSCPPAGSTCADGVTANYSIPEISISLTRVYFLDGETEVKSLGADGTVTSIKSIDAPPNSQVAFSVSPDDRRMAVSIITLATSLQPEASFSDQMYVEDLATTANRVELYSSHTEAVWPVAWHAGDLIVATGTMEPTFDNPYGATGYHVVDPATGHDRASLDCAFGLLVSAGTACASGWCGVFEGPCGPGTLGAQAWNGTKTAFSIPSGPPPHIVRNGIVTHLSPDGGRLAVDVVTDQQTGASITMLFQNGTAGVIAGDATPQGWLDKTHLVVSSGSGVKVVDTDSGAEFLMTALKTIPQQGMPQLAGVLPDNLG